MLNIADLIVYLFFAVIAYAILFIIVKNAVKNGVKEALQDLRLLDKDALRTIDVPERGNGDNGLGS